SVEVLPDMHLPVPGPALTIGCLYVGGPPIIVLRLAEPVLASGLRALVPARWRDRLVGASVGGAGAVASLFWIREWSGRAAAAAEWASFALGLAVRWWIVSRLVPGADVTGHPAAIAVAELAGYLAWAPMAALPIYSYRPFLPPAPAFRGLETVIQDLQLVFIVTLTPLVFLIVYGYATHGLAGAAVWSLAALGLHVMLKRLTERRIAVEEQNRRLEALNRELEHRERLSAIGKMSSVISHQMLQQLGVIGIYADLIRHAEAEGDPAAAVCPTERRRSPSRTAAPASRRPTARRSSRPSSRPRSTARASASPSRASSPRRTGARSRPRAATAAGRRSCCACRGRGQLPREVRLSRTGVAKPSRVSRPRSAPARAPARRSAPS